MIGTIRWNFIVAAVAFALTFLLSMGNNIWLTTLLRSFYSFIVLFIVVFACRWLLGTFAGLNRAPVSQAGETDEDELKGTSFDALTPDEDDEINRLLKDSLDPKPHQDSDFSPLNPPKLSTKVQEQPPEELAQALRRMSEE